MFIDSFLTKEEIKDVSNLIKENERETSGEIVVLISDRSSNYELSAVFLSFFLSFIFGFVITLLSLNSYISELNIFLLSFLVFYVGFYYFIFKKDFLFSFRRYFLNPTEVRREVSRAALANFYSEKLYNTKASNGVLIYVSLFEKVAFILADKGINEKVKEGVWEEIVKELCLNLKETKVSISLIKAINRVGVLLKEHFEIKEDDKNELHDLIIKKYSEEIL